MSSRVNINMCLIASKGLLPTNKLHEVFMETLSELNGTINNGVLYINDFRVGLLSLKERIVIQTYSEHAEQVKTKTTKLREIFSRRAQVAIDDYKRELEIEKKKLECSDLEYTELLKRIEETDRKIKEQAQAVKKQQMSSCEAIVLELKEAAENQGYDILEEKTDEGIELQLIRRIY